MLIQHHNESLSSANAAAKPHLQGLQLHTSASTKLYCSFSLTATAALAGMVQGVVVQMARAAPKQPSFSSAGTCSPIQQDNRVYLIHMFMIYANRVVMNVNLTVRYRNTHPGPAKQHISM